MFIPTTAEEVRSLGWDGLDVILVSGDTYIDSPSMGMSIIGHVLIDAGYRVGIIAQPRIDSDDIARLGEPRLFWGISSGSVDSMVSNYNADRSRRKQDDLTPGGLSGARPDRACIAYTGLVRRFFKNTVPIVLGGLEASLRRVAHYDYWQNKIRRSLLFDAKADMILYGMGDISILSLADALSEKSGFTDLPGLCCVAREAPDDALELPSFEEVSSDLDAFQRMFMLFAANSQNSRGRRLSQKHGDRYLVHNPPARMLTEEELDAVYELPYERAVHPYYSRMGEVRALDTIRYSITTHRGCFGGCSFCSISIHQGGGIVSRSEDSILREAEAFTKDKNFKGVISDVGGATANMYGMKCRSMGDFAPCGKRRCLVPSVCRSLHVDHSRLLNLLKRLRSIPGIKHVFVASGIRYDLILQDETHGEAYLEELLHYHISGLMRLAPEHSSERVLELMGKPGFSKLAEFKKMFRKTAEKFHLKSDLSYYLMAAHPGCTVKDMQMLEKDMSEGGRPVPASVQIFTPTPSTYSTLIYHTGLDPATGASVFVEKDMGKKKKQKNLIRTYFNTKNKKSKSRS